MPYTQTNRPAKIATPLGADKLLFKSLSGTERLGRPFQYELLLLSTDPDIDYKKIVGKEVTVTVKSPYESSTRYFNGVISSFAQTTYSKELSQYVATMVPKFWFTSLTADCRIFQNKPVKDILSTIIKTEGEVTDYRDSASATTPTREYCVQYRETDFDFASRLMEEEGIYYFFEHKDGKHTLVLCDSPASHAKAEKADTVPFIMAQTPGNEKPGMTSWNARYEAQPGAFVHADYDFKNPNNVLRSNELVSRNHTGSDREIFDYPGMFEKAAEGDRLAKVRLHERQTRHVLHVGETTALTLATGTKFDLKEHPKAAYNREYLVVENEVLIENAPYRASQEDSTDLKVRSRITAIPSDQTYRPARLTPRPNVRGPHTAVVVGPKGEEVHTDKYGRIKVQFHWDREGKKDQNASIFVRVAQAWAGKGWGAMFIPRIGQEVVVEFLEGEPDRPLVTGCVYNEVNNAPYALPDHKTRSAIRTNSSSGGGGYNEIRFEDKKDAEQLFVHAQKDQDNRVLNDSKEWIGNNRHLIVTKDQYEKVGQDRHEKIVRDHLVEVTRDVHLKVGGKQAAAITGKFSLTVDDDVVEVFKKNHSEVVTKDLFLQADNLTIEAKTNLTLHVGDAFIAIDKDGIKISTPGKIAIEATGDLEQKGNNVKIEATANLQQKAGADAKIEATNVNIAANANAEIKGTAGLKLESSAQAKLSGSASVGVESSGMTEIKGSLVKIN
jgi:type VI secretion system secreted protein VgrG